MKLSVPTLAIYKFLISRKSETVVYGCCREHGEKFEIATVSRIGAAAEEAFVDIPRKTGTC